MVPEGFGILYFWAGGTGAFLRIFDDTGATRRDLRAREASLFWAACEVIDVLDKSRQDKRYGR